MAGKVLVSRMKYCPLVIGGTCSDFVPRAARLLDSTRPSLLRVQICGSGAAPSSPSKLSHSWDLHGRGAPPRPGTPPSSAGARAASAGSAAASGLGAPASLALPPAPVAPEVPPLPVTPPV